MQKNTTITRLLFLVCLATDIFSQTRDNIAHKRDMHAPKNADSNYIARFDLPNEIRTSYGGDASSLGFGTTENGQAISTDLFNNATDLLGFGLTYKFFDGDINFSLPNTRLANEDRQNLSQIKLILSTSMRKLSIRGFISDTRGLISVDENSNFKTNPDVRLTRITVQLTYNFNSSRYSYRASNFQNEFQKKSAVAFLLRLEPSYRFLKAPLGFVPEQPRAVAVSLYGAQASVDQIQGPSVLLLPGIGWNYAIGNSPYFISPILMAGPGLSLNSYKGYENAGTHLNYDIGAFAVLNAGYNGTRFYVTLRVAYEGAYSSLNPSYLTNTNLRGTLTLSYRFVNLEKVIPNW